MTDAAGLGRPEAVARHLAALAERIRLHGLRVWRRSGGSGRRRGGYERERDRHLLAVVDLIQLCAGIFTLEQLREPGLCAQTYVEAYETSTEAYGYVAVGHGYMYDMCAFYFSSSSCCSSPSPSCSAASSPSASASASSALSSVTRPLFQS